MDDNILKYLYDNYIKFLKKLKAIKVEAKELIHHLNECLSKVFLIKIILKEKY